jgi:hypothetical protein
MTLNPKVLQIGDVIVTTHMGAFDTVTRIKTWPGRNCFDMSLGTHCGVVADRGGGLFYLSEMQPKGLEFGELHKYDNPRSSWRNHVVGIYRHSMFDNEQVRTLANDYMIKMHSFGVKYGYDDLLRTVWPEFPNPDHDMICSQWARSVWEFCKISTPFKPDESGPVTPADWQRWGMSGLIVVRGK